MKNTKTQRGFTLVELAIVLVIVGLLISGVLKGQELIANAQLNSTVAKAKSIESAGVTFRDNYSYLPGDLPNGATRLQNCAGLCALAASNGDGRIGVEDAYGIATAATAAGAPTQNENNAAWAQLSAANLIGEVSSNAQLAEIGTAVPSAAVGGGFRVGFEGNGTIAGVTQVAGTATAGHYLNLTNSVVTALAAASTVTTALLMERLDKKMDDGKPATGSVLAIGSVGAAQANCATTNTQAGVYNVAGEGLNCGAVIRIFN